MPTVKVAVAMTVPTIPRISRASMLASSVRTSAASCWSLVLHQGLDAGVRASTRPLGASDGRLDVEMDTGGLCRLNRSSRSCLTTPAQ